MQYLEIFTTIFGGIIIGLLATIMILSEALESARSNNSYLEHENKKLKRKFDSVQNTRRLERR